MLDSIFTTFAKEGESNEKIHSDNFGNGAGHFNGRKCQCLEDSLEEGVLEYLEKPGMEEKTRLLRILICPGVTISHIRIT